MRQWRAFWVRSSLAGLLAATAVAPASAIWGRVEFLGGDAGSAYVGGRLLDVSLYQQRYGVGLGTSILDLRFHGWDVPRRGAPDASGHALTGIGPVNAYVALGSWEGIPFFIGDSEAHPTVGRLEAYGNYCGWGKLWGFTEGATNSLGEPERQRVGGSIPASYWDYGLRLDIGAYWGLAAGRFAFETEREGVFRRRYSSQWYVKTFLYLGATWGESAGGGVGWVLRDAWTGMRRLFHRTRKEQFIED